MNLGLLLKKPGESRYGQFRRFLISNYSSYGTESKLRYNLLTLWQDYEPLIKENNLRTIQTSFVARQYENRLLDRINHNNDNYVSQHNETKRPQQHCQICSTIGYHTNLFEISDITQCPIHNTALKEKCVKCNNIWPVLSDLYKRKCSDCGIHIRLKDIIAIEDPHATDKYNTISELLDFFTEIKTSNKLMFLNDDISCGIQNDTRGCNINYRSEYYSSICAAENTISIKLQNDLRKCGLDLYEIYSIEFPAIQSQNLKTSNSPRTDFIKEIIIEINSDIYKFLVKRSNSTHKPGDCYKEDFCNFCIPCTTRLIWELLTRDFLKSYNIKQLNDDISKNSYSAHVFLTHITYWTNLSFPRLPIHIVSFDSNNIEHPITKYLIPNNAQILIFKTDLWTIFIHLYYCIKHIKNNLNNNKYRSEILSKLVRSRNAKFCPYFVRHNDYSESSIVISLPKILADRIFNEAIYERLL
ncbi:MAG: hypothetical protein KJO88_05480 [Gammaproteobacteria bacterium]|nr:hypothetical protein [Gammaproteobacteria bacterium]